MPFILKMTTKYLGKCEALYHELHVRMCFKYGGVCQYANTESCEAKRLMDIQEQMRQRVSLGVKRLEELAR
jgi:hypothetical protein